MTTPTRRVGRQGDRSGTLRRRRRLSPEIAIRGGTALCGRQACPPANVLDPDMGLIDISQPLSPATAVWPGDQPVKWDWTARIEDGSSVNLGAMTLSTHAGTHADAPLHVRAEGGTTDDFDLSAFVGPAEVVSVGDDAIHPRHVEDVDAQRILFKTSASARPPDDWPESVAALNPDTVTALAARDSVLIGTDAPSVDPLDSTELVAHHALIEAGIVNLEGLSLAGVEPGRYQLLALPLKVTGADAAPVRAILRT